MNNFKNKGNQAIFKLDPRKRQGFTLVELLIVVAIITLLASISAGVVFKLLETQKKSTTDTTVKLLQNAINRITTSTTSTARMDYLKRNKYFFQLIAKDLTNGFSSPFVPPLIGIIDPIRAGELVYVNTQLARTFPQRITDFKLVAPGDIIPVENNIQLPVGFPPNKPIVNMDFIPLTSTDPNVRKFISLRYNQNNERSPLPSTISEFEGNLSGFYTTANKNVSDPAIDLDIQAAACLYFAIASHPEGLKKDELKSAVTSLTVIKGSTTYQIPYLSDASGKPIYFQMNYKDARAASGNVEKEVPQGTVSLSLVYGQEG